MPHKKNKEVCVHQVLTFFAARGMKTMWKVAQSSLLEDERLKKERSSHSAAVMVVVVVLLFYFNIGSMVWEVLL